MEHIHTGEQQVACAASSITEVPRSFSRSRLGGKNTVTENFKTWARNFRYLICAFSTLGSVYVFQMVDLAHGSRWKRLLEDHAVPRASIEAPLPLDEKTVEARLIFAAG